MTTKEIALEKIKELVSRFEEHLPALKSGKYKEHNLRQEYLNPFWEALGWDIHNTKGLPQSYKEVEQEDTLKIENLRGAPDYCFRKSKDKRFFYLEAKKPIENIKENNAHALQTRTYGWNGNLSISILSDFEEFGLYDCTKKPKETDTVRTARLEYMTYKDYEKNFDFLWDTFSRDAVFGGSIDQFASKKIKRGKDTVDKEFLISLDKWRTQLAENISLRNKNEIDEDQLNFSVQQIIDRLIFLRIAEDRNIEPYGNLSAQLSGDNYYRNILGVFTNANNRYNSGLFDPTKDTTTTELEIDNKVIKEIVSEMYYPKSPYLFDVISVEILGSAYEQFLGKTITINNRGKAIIELKPEIRKAGGVYYTPQYIVDYIVENTVGKLLENKKPTEASELKICDPACGSGSFLLGAYQYLLNWHKDYYLANPPVSRRGTGKSPSSGGVGEVFTPEGNLTTGEKKRILLNNIYGVDIDTNAVEVTKLSLLLKCMEGETQASIAHQMTMFNERVLPTLDDNIKSGNSLIDTDFYDGMIEFEERKIKPFNWQKAFPTVFKNGGFDVVIGNPPYDVLEKERLGEINPHIALQNYILRNNSFKNALGGKLNLYRFFVVKTIQLAKLNGRFGLIIPSSILADKSCTSTRKFLLEYSKDLELDCFPQKDNPTKRIFEDAKLSTTIFTGVKSEKTNDKIRKFIIRTYPSNSFQDAHKKCEIDIKELSNIDPNNIPIPLIDKMNWEILKNIHSKQGIRNLGFINDFIIRRGEINQTIFKEYIEENLSNNERLIKGVQIGQYKFNKILSQGKIEWFNENKFLKNNSKREISNFRRIATQRITGIDEKLRLVATIVEPKSFFADSTNSIHLSTDSKYDLKYLLSIINSKLFQWRFKLTSTNNNVGTNELEALPFKEIDFTNKKEVESYDQIVSSVDQLLQLNKDLQAETLESKKEQIKRKIDHFEDKINELVYKLYDLTEEEIKIVENG